MYALYFKEKYCVFACHLRHFMSVGWLTVKCAVGSGGRFGSKASSILISGMNGRLRQRGWILADMIGVKKG